MVLDDVRAAASGSYLAQMPPEVTDDLLNGGARTDFPAGATIYRAGETPRSYLVITGLLRVFMSSPEGRQVTIRYARDGDVLGTAVALGGPVNVGVQTLQECSLFSVDIGRLLRYAYEDAHVAMAIAGELNSRLYESLQQTAIHAFGTIRQRVAVHLLDLASAQQATGERLVARVTQQDLADAIGSVREVVARALRELRLAGAIATGSDSIVILDAPLLIAESGRSREQ